jgi:predicted AAA+ superfamily ATPase
VARPTVEEINEYNPWIKGEKFETPAFRRSIYSEVKEEVERRRFIVSIVGIRRVGKTVLMKQIGNEMNGDRFFFSFDEEAYQNIDALKFVISYFLRISKSKPFIFLDEIGRVRNWAGVVKKYHDLNKATFIISSSSYLHITKGKESLAGRLKDFTLPPWSFEEYLRLKNMEIKPIKEENIERAYVSFSPRTEKEITDYLKKGSFPEIADEDDEAKIKKYVKNSTVEKLIFEDLSRVFPVEHTDKLYDILVYLAKNSGSILNYTSLGQILGLSKDTVKRYVFYLEKALIMDTVPLFGSVVKIIRKGRKVYPACSPIAFSYQEFYNEPALVENAVLSKLKETFEDIKFYRDSFGREVDFVINNIPIEVKWKSELSSEDFKNILYFMNKYNLDFGIIVSKRFDLMEKGSKRVYILPLDFFLLYDLNSLKILNQQRPS